MNDLKSVFLEAEDWPEWFTLDFGVDPPRLLIGINEEVLGRLVPLLQKTPILATFSKQLEENGNDSEFLLDPAKPWGFGGVLTPCKYQHSDSPDYLAWFSIGVPLVEKDVGVCDDCDGSKEDGEGMNCLRCSGTGRKTVMDWKVAKHIAMTLSSLCFLFQWPDKELVDGLKTNWLQLLSLQTHYEMGCAPLGAILASPFGFYVRSFSNTSLPLVKEAMKNTYLTAFPGYKRFGDYHFDAVIRERGQLSLTVPGDACGLLVDGFDSSLRMRSGYLKLTDHNVDSSIQQLSLVCGLAAFTGMARKAIGPK